MPPLIIPWNHQPVDNLTKTGAFNIPAGQYHRLTAALVEGGALAVNGVTLATAQPPLVAILATCSSSVDYTVGADRFFEGAFLNNAAGNVLLDVGGNQYGPSIGNGDIRDGIKSGPGQVWGTNDVSANQKMVGYERPSYGGPVLIDIWVEALTAITIGGAVTYHLEQYNNIDNP